jgi:hypothetical protein
MDMPVLMKVLIFVLGTIFGASLALVFDIWRRG